YPSIVSIRFFGFRHYWLVYESRDTWLMVMDPAIGRLARVRKKTFATLWTGVFMCIKPKGLTT
ncbi:MAG: cysteine peptidase family C39 domain-containing protein, partial [Flavobacteriaceae bacterium]